MVRRETQKRAYWEKFAVKEHDLEYLYGLLLEAELPLSIDELTLALIRERCDREERLIEEELEKGHLFQPKESYEVGEKLIFPAFDYVLGTVVSVRPGHNPRYDPFEVIQVRFEGRRKEREFASALKAPHALNQQGIKVSLASPEELCASHGEDIQPKLVERLRDSEEFVNLGNRWFLRGLLADLQAGHLNIAEASIEEEGIPLPIEGLLEELDISTEMKKDASLFSLNYALAHDERFDEVGTKEKVLWFLRRLEPKQVVEQPFHLCYQPEPYDRSVLDEEMLQIEREIDDETMDLAAPEEPASSATIVLTYPHRRAGTIPLTTKTRGLFPCSDTQRTYITLLDCHTDRRIEGWVVHEASYVYGLGKWYEEYAIPTGAYIELERTDDPLVVQVSYIPRPKRREWVRVARVSEGRLAFEMQMRPLACDYDELMIMSWEDPTELDVLWRKVEEEHRSLYQLLCELLPELAKLNPQGIVHAKTLYSAINVVRRCPPGPILVELTTRPCFISVGDSYWIYDENLKG